MVLYTANCIDLLLEFAEGVSLLLRIELLCARQAPRISINQTISIPLFQVDVFAHVKKQNERTTSNGGSLGSCIDEERCQLR